MYPLTQHNSPGIFAKPMKWSSGEPFTADDVMFWYEAEAMNEDLRPAGVGSIKINDKMGVPQKIDDYTVRWTLSFR